MISWAEMVKEYHEILGTTNKCYILCCGRKAEVVVTWRKNGEQHFYCKECANDLVTQLPRLFVKKEEV